MENSPQVHQDPQIRKKSKPNSDNQAKLRKPISRILPSSLTQVSELAKLYNKLVENEKLLDKTISSRRMMFYKHQNGTEGLLRIFVSNTTYTENDERYWNLRIQLRALKITKDNKQTEIECNVLQFIKFIHIEAINENTTGTEVVASWNSANSDIQEESNGFEIKRKFNQTQLNCRIIIAIVNKEEETEYLIDEKLAKLIDMKKGSKNQILEKLLDYIKIKKLFQNQSIITLDENLSSLFECSNNIMNIPEMLMKINMKIKPLDPICISYTINNKDPYNSLPYFVQTKIWLKEENNIQQNKTEILQIEDQIIKSLISIQNTHKKALFMHQFAKNPLKFVKDWSESQSRNLEIVLGEKIMEYGKLNSSQLYSSHQINNAVFHYLYNKNKKNVEDSFNQNNH